jgi:hypothetical protein
MKQLLILVVVGVLFIIPAAAGTGTFANGGFEDGSFNSWTTGGGYWYGGSENPTSFLPGGAKYDANVFPARSAVVSVGTDPITGLPTVYNGSYAARVNDYTPNAHVSVISQTVTNYTDPNIYFAWAAVLEESHGVGDSDNFSLVLTDDTTNTTLYSVSYDSAQAAYANLFKTVYYPYTYDTWYYTNWQVNSLDVSKYQGDTFTLTLMGSDCPYTGHGGYVYLDGFGGAPPVQTTPEPATLLLAGSGVGFLLIRRRNRK